MTFRQKPKEWVNEAARWRKAGGMGILTGDRRVGGLEELKGQGDRE